MNERIQELADRALDQAVPETWSTLTCEQLGRFQEKLAELIVQKCVSIVALHGITNFENEDISWACKNIVKEVKEHFGVE